MRTFTVLLAACCLASQVAASEPIVGRASVIDGDTVEVHGVRIRLFGIDAPESRQTCEDAAGTPYRCGQTAALRLDAHIDSRPISCEPRDIDRYGRTVAVCSVAGDDLGRWLVGNGLAIAYRHYSRDYVPAEEAAHEAKSGIWSGSFINPAEWRRRR